MIPRKYASLNSPIMAINVITSCLSTVPSDCSSVFSVIDNDWKVKGELITETEISQLSTISEDKYYKKEIELEYQDCSDDPSILFNNNMIKSHISTVIDTKKLKSALPLHILYAFPVTRARVYKSFPKNLFHEVRYAKEQAIWSQPNANKIHSVILMVSTINGMEEKNFPLPIDEDSNNIIKEDRCSEKSYQIIINEELINSKRLENDIESFEVEETICSRREILCEEIVDEGIVDDNKRYTMKFRLEKEENSTRREGASLDKEKIVSKNFKGSMNIRDRLAEYKNSFIDYSNRCMKKCRDIAPHPLNAYFPEKNIQFKEFVEYDKLPKKVVKKEPINIRTKIYPIKKEDQGSTKYSTIVDTVNENEALEEGEINFSMIGTEIDDSESSTNCSTTIQEVNCEKLNQKLNNINIENEYSDDSSKLISLPNTFSFLSKDFTTSCDARRVVKRNYTDTWTSTTIENDDETIIYEDMLQQLNSIKNVLNNFDVL